MRPKLKSDVKLQPVGDEVLVLDMASDQIHQLNATAAWILAHCDGNRSSQAIADAFAEQYAIDNTTASKDVAAVLAQLEQVNIIEPG